MKHGTAETVIGVLTAIAVVAFGVVVWRLNDDHVLTMAAYIGVLSVLGVLGGSAYIDLNRERRKMDAETARWERDKGNA